MIGDRGRKVRWSDRMLMTIVCLMLIVIRVGSVKRGDFKTCEQAGFCKRGRERSIRAASPEYGPGWKSPYLVHEAPSWSEDTHTLHARLVNELYPGVTFALNVTVLAESEGTLRIKLDQLAGLRQRYNEADKWTLLGQPKLLHSKHINLQISQDQTLITWSGNLAVEYQLLLQHQPFKISLLRDGQPHIILNQRGLFNMEHFRNKPKTNDEGLLVQEPSDPTVVSNAEELYPGFKETTEDGMWEETFGGRTDQKPKGPESLALDITFPGYSHVFGIPEHASPLSLKTTRGSPESAPAEAYTDPYRLWNLDVFEYEADSEMALYGAIPMMKAHRAGSTVGVFWLNAAETWVDVEKRETRGEVVEAWKAGASRRASSSGEGVTDEGPTGTSTETYWMSESGILDLFLFLGPSSAEIFSSFAALVGTTILPPYFSIAYHQCRWNYVSQEDLLSVVQNFDKFDIPLDVMWLDIEYAEDHKYFIWDKRHFPEPMKMINELEATGRKLVTIVDPHIKRTQDLYVYKEAVERNVLCKLPDGSEYEGWCWTGSSSWVDYFDPSSWDWWAGLFKFNKYKESTVNVHNWLDMNEPSVFNAPEITMPRDNIHHGGWEHRDLHNLNGMASHNQSARGLRERTDPPMRGFVLSRSFFAGSQRYGAIWQGDNMGTWQHLAVSIPMLLSNSIAGMAFNGADVGGFFGNPSPELLVRWYQAGAFFPFFRAHAHIDTKRREPYLFDEPIRGQIVDMIKLRYTLLPSWYTLFFENTLTGAPMTVPQYVMFPKDDAGFAVDDQFYLGSTGLLVKPITQEGATSTDVYISDDQPYYNYFTSDMFLVDQSKGSPRTFTFPAPLGTVPLFQRGGHIVTRRDLIRRAAPLMWKDPITLVVALDKQGQSTGTLYLDDGESFNHERGQFLYKRFSIKKESSGSFTLSSSDAVAQTLKSTHEALRSSLAQYQPDNGWIKKISSVNIDKVIILGLPDRPTCVKVSGRNDGLAYQYSSGLASTVKSAKMTGLGKRASVLEIQNAAVKVVDDWSIEVGFKEACTADPSTIQPDPFVSLQSEQCAPGYFQCKNVGHLPSCIRISRVNDGICEPECCDGSDEASNAHANCPNRCEAIGAAHRKKREKQIRKFKAGNSERKNYSLYGLKEKARLEDSIGTLTLEIENLQAKELQAKAELDRVEKISQTQIAKLKETNLFRKISGFQNSIKQLRSQNDQLQKDLDQLNNILKDLKAGYNPNYQDMVVKGAVKGFEEWEAEKASGQSTEADNNEVVKIPLNEELDGMVNEDPVDMITAEQEQLGGGHERVESMTSGFDLADHLPEWMRKTYIGVRDKILDGLQTLAILPSSLQNAGSKSTDSGTSTTDRPDVVKAKTRFHDAQSARENAHNSLAETRAKLALDWGPDWEFKKLDQTCLELNHAEYVYEVCLFGEAYQKSKHGDRTSLGRFSHWNKDAPQGSPEYYSKQVYTNGHKCWNGPERSLNLEIRCGTKNELYSVMEPEKCEYLIKMTSPAVCRDGLDSLDDGHHLDHWVVLRDEL
ncbi:hypothetical protein PGT21_011415 [Puccinia graminis f. sp. tritici]|uniref:Glucosidase 2 subunit beta n=1 Tax=Puccinia graminis f. sp. tritici TaxID=56615 RepID=A0A5B0M8D0_PUCGR|nr:hypothetical protein PGT21_011415 [Puccinia graminis f. sp. tritici]